MIIRGKDHKKMMPLKKSTMNSKKEIAASNSRDS